MNLKLLYMSTLIEINKNIFIPEEELSFSTARSSGPGGQNVNKIESKVILYFDIAASFSLTDLQKQRIFEKLATRISKAGVLRVISQKYRTQAANKKVVVEKFRDLIQTALKRPARRKKTVVPKAAKEMRLKQKSRHSQLKKQRAKVKDYAD